MGHLSSLDLSHNSIGPNRIVNVLEALIFHNIPLLYFAKVGPDMDDTWRTYEGEELGDILEKVFS